MINKYVSVKSGYRSQPWEGRAEASWGGSRMQTSFCGQSISLNWISWVLCAPGVEAASGAAPVKKEGASILHGESM